MRSKRRALRFDGAGHRVSYKTACEEGEAILVNVSTGGCALMQLSLQLSLKEKILVSIAMPNRNIAFQAQGVVVRKENDFTAVHFSLVEPGDLNQMRIYFSRKTRKEE